MVPTLGRVRRYHRETSDTFSIDVEPEDRQPFSFAPGQFNMLYLFGVGEIPISISGDPSVENVYVHTTREVGTVTRAMRKLKPGAMIGVRGPFGTAWPLDVAEGKDLVVIAGGIGLAPLRPVIYSALGHRERFNRVVLLFGARSPTDLLFRGELRRWRARLDMDVQVTVDHATDSWRGNVGVITQLIPRAGFNPSNAIAMVCGPEIMMRYATVELQKRGLADDQIFVSMERNMKCAIGLCGHCQFGRRFVCRDGPIYRYDDIARYQRIEEI
jgi:NAD(P)H-flavin reductase